MAFQDSKGNKFTNHGAMKSSEAKLKAQPPKQPGEAEQEIMGEEHEPAPANDGAQIAQEHGPANMVDIQHDHEGGRHHVSAMHPDGHQHESDHASAGEAHKFAADVAGAM